MWYVDLNLTSTYVESFQNLPEQARALRIFFYNFLPKLSVSVLVTPPPTTVIWGSDFLIHTFYHVGDLNLIFSILKWNGHS